MAAPDMIEKEKPKATEPWTDKQLSTVRQNCVTITIEWSKANPNAKIDLLPFANMLYNYILKNELPKEENEE